MISKRRFKKIIWTNILESNTKDGLSDEIKQFQINNPESKIIDIKYNHDALLTASGTYCNVIHDRYSAMIIYK